MAARGRRCLVTASGQVLRFEAMVAGVAMVMLDPFAGSDKLCASLRATLVEVLGADTVALVCTSADCMVIDFRQILGRSK